LEPPRFHFKKETIAMINVPLKSLIFGGEIDSRTEQTDITSLTKSIEALGLILPLSVMQVGDKYRVIDGNRRLAALKIVHKGKKNVEVPVHLQDADIDQSTARALSLAANIERLPLHPADQYQAFAKIAADGKALAEIASIFGISERAVKQRMALGSLRFEVLDAYRAGSLSPKLAQLMTRITPDQQWEVMLTGESDWQMINRIQAMTNTEALAPTCGLARYITRETYEAAGGTFVTDLFVEEGNELWADPQLASALADQMLVDVQLKTVDEGWQFFERTDEWVGQNYILEDPAGEPVLLDETQIARANLLRSQLDEFEKLWADEERDVTDDERREMNAVEHELNGLEDEVRSWTDEQKGRLGVVVDAHYTVHYGAKHREGAKSDSQLSSVADKEDKAQAQSTAVMMELDAHLTNGVRGALVDRPDIAVRLLALTFLSDYFLLDDKLRPLHAGVGIRCDFSGNVLPASEYGLQDILDIAKASGLLKAKTFEAKMVCTTKMSDHDIKKIITFFVARSMMKQHRGSDLVLYLDKVKALKIRDHFTPTVDNLFGRLTKAQLQLVMKEAGLADDISDMKKKEAAEFVAARLPADWIPEAIRPTKPT